MALESSERIASDDFAQSARHPDFPKAFTRSRKLPLPALIGALLSMRNQSQQAMLDGFFASVCGTEGLHREVSDRAFAKAREHLHQLRHPHARRNLPALHPRSVSASSASPLQASSLCRLRRASIRSHTARGRGAGDSTGAPAARVPCKGLGGIVKEHH